MISASSVLECDDFSVLDSSGRVPLHHISFHVESGQRLAIVGPSGCGKSTLLDGFLGTISAASGTVRWFGDSLRHGRGLPSATARRIGIMFQDGGLFEDLSVAANCAMPLQLDGSLSHRLVNETVGRTLAQVGAESIAERLPLDLSGGERKRAALARALASIAAARASEARALVCDEPTAGLDPIAAGEFGRLLESLTRSRSGRPGGLALILITHDVYFLERFATHALVLSSDSFMPPRGRVVAHGSIAELRENPAMAALLHPNQSS